jgi:hypothetical protein
VKVRLDLDGAASVVAEPYAVSVAEQNRMIAASASVNGILVGLRHRDILFREIIGKIAEPNGIGGKRHTERSSKEDILCSSAIVQLATKGVKAYDCRTT